jgi:hypothetical protein
MILDDVCLLGKGAEGVGQLGCKVWIWKQVTSGKCTNLDTGVPMLALCHFCHMTA